MKTSVLDVLSFMFEHFMEDETESHFDRDIVGTELANVGFDPEQVSAAFDWLEGLNPNDDEFTECADGTKSLRVYTAPEMRCLTREGRGFLLFLEQVGLLDTRSRELVIDRAVALGSEDIDLEQLKWIVLMVLLNQPGQEQTAAWMEGLVMDEVPGSVH